MWRIIYYSICHYINSLKYQERPEVVKIDIKGMDLASADVLGSAKIFDAHGLFIPFATPKNVSL